MIAIINYGLGNLHSVRKAVAFVGGEAVVIDDAEKIYRGRNILRKYWLYTLIWVILLLWGLKEIL